MGGDGDGDSENEVPELTDESNSTPKRTSRVNQTRAIPLAETFNVVGAVRDQRMEMIGPVKRGMGGSGEGGVFDSLLVSSTDSGYKTAVKEAKPP
jgi:hypothetical protein